MTKRKVARKKTVQQDGLLSGRETAHILGTSEGGYEGLLGFLRDFNGTTHDIVYGPQLEEKPLPRADLDNSPEADKVRGAYALPMDKLYELANQELDAAEEKRTPQRRKITLSDHEKKVWGVIQRKIKKEAYCRELHNAGATPSKKWISEGCPGTYPGAYMLPHWRKRIQDEKYRIRRKAERPGLANQSSITR